MTGVSSALLPVMAGLLLTAAPLHASSQSQTEAAPATADEIVVSARLSGAPIWTAVRDGRTLVLVGALEPVPKGLDWNVVPLEQAAARADRVLYPVSASFSVGDVFRLLFRGGKITDLPKGRTIADYLPAPLMARLERVMAAEKSDDWRRKSPVVLAFRLLGRHAGLARGGRSIRDVVADAARRADVPGRSIGTVRGKEVIDNLMAQDPAAYRDCMAASIAAAEAGRDAAAHRAEAWRTRDIPALLADPLDTALSRCWPWADPAIGPRLKRNWTDALDTALAAPGTTLAVAPARLAAEPGGLLDRLAANGFRIEGPRWRD